jgi:hypothetical protein
MSRLVYSVAFGFCLSVLSISSVGCGGADNEVIEETRTQAEIDQADEDYEAQMEADAAADVAQ